MLAAAWPRAADKRFGAMIGRDFKALEAMVHDDLLYTHSSGTRAGSGVNRTRVSLRRGGGLMRSRVLQARPTTRFAQLKVDY
jgi:hypothetical protein